MHLVCATPVTEKQRVNLSALLRHFLAPVAAVLLVPLLLSVVKRGNESHDPRPTLPSPHI